MNAEKFYEFLQSKNACSNGLEFAKGKSMQTVWNTCHRGDWMMWLYKFRNPNRKKCIQIAIFRAEQCIGDFERKYPNDKDPRKAIDAAKAVLKNDTKENREKAKIASDSAYASACDSDFASAYYSACASVYASAFASACAFSSAFASVYYSAFSSAFSSIFASASAEQLKEQADLIRKLIPNINEGGK